MADAPATTETTNEWPGAFAVFKPSLRTVAFNLMPFLATLAISFVFSIIPDLQKQIADAGTVNGLIDLLATLGSVIASIATTIVLLKAAALEKISTNDALTSALSYTLKYIGLTILTVMIAIGSFVLLVVPFFFVMPRISLAYYYLLDKDMGVIDSLKASWNDTKGHVGKVYGIVGANIVMFLPVFTIIGIPVAIFLLVAYSASTILLYKYIVTGKFEAPAVD